MYYIQEIDKPSWLRRTFKIVQLEKNKIILPIETDKIGDKKAQKLAKKTKKILDKTNCNKLVISKNVKKIDNYMNQLYTCKYLISDSKWLFELLTIKVLDFVMEKFNIKKQETQIAILVNDLTENSLENIRIIVKQYKCVSIITNHIEKFKKLEQQLLEENGIMITITNNRKKSLAKAQIILNVDFPTELINKYYINEKAIIINLKGNVKIEKKRFNGININDYEIKVKNDEELDKDFLTKYKMADVYETKLYKKTPYKNLMEILEKDKVEILMLQTNNSKI